MERPFLPIVLLATLAAAVPAQSNEPPLTAADGWNAARIHSAPGGVWYAVVDELIPDYGPPELVVADDTGQVTVLADYSGRWSARSTTPDHQWLAPSRAADVDPRIAGKELYAAGRAGNVHRLHVVRRGAARFELESVEIGHAPAEEFHAIVAGDLIPDEPGDELLVFGLTGAAYRLVPDTGDAAASEAAFEMRRVATLPGRVRDAVVVPAEDGAVPTILGVSRSGHLLAMQLTARGLDHRVLAHEPMGLGRIAHRPAEGERPAVSWVTRDDGVVLRFARGSDGALAREVVFAGEQGPRGIAAGRFFDDPAREGVAVYGYGKAVQIVSRAPGGPWEVATIFTGDVEGHWLCAAELDGRNATDELIATSFDGQVVLLAREPGYGLLGVATPKAAEAPESAPRGTPERPWRIAVAASEVAVEGLSPLDYQGGFETKSLVYETLVRRGPDGRIVPGLAASWQVSDEGRAFTFRLREGATFHDGEPVTAAAVAVHFRRWVGLPEHDWLRCNQRIRAVEAVSPSELRITLDRPYALLPDLCALNPTAIRGPGALDREGRFVRPIGSGPFAAVANLEDGRVLRYRRHREGPPVFLDLVRLGKTPQDDPLDALLRAEVDAVLGSWLVAVDPARAIELRDDPRFTVVDGPGSSMTYLGFRRSGPTAELAVRRHVTAAIDRDELVRVCAHGFGDPSTGWAAPSITIWPQGTPVPVEGPPPALERPLRLLGARRRPESLATTIAAQLCGHGLPTEVVPEGSQDWDIRIEITYGVPYDPYVTAVSRFLPPPGRPTAQSPRYAPVAAAVSKLVAKATATPDEAARYRVYEEIQAALDADASIVPLYAPRRIAIHRAGMPSPVLDHDLYALDARYLTDR